MSMLTQTRRRGAECAVVVLLSCAAVLPGSAHADDTALIQAIISRNQGGTARLPLGTYIVSGLRVPANTRVTTQLGGTPFGTTLKLLPDPPAGTVTTPILFITGSGVTIDTLTFDGDVDHQTSRPGSYANAWNGRYDSAAIRIDPVSGLEARPFLENILIANCWFQNTRGAAIATKRTLVGLTVRDNHFEALNFEAVFLDHQEGTSRSSNIRITNNEVLDTRDIPVQPPPPEDGEDASFYGGLGFLVNQVSGLTFQGNRGRNIPKNLIKASNVSTGVLSNNVMTTNWLPAFSGIQLDSLVTDVEVSGNLLEDVYRGIEVNGFVGSGGISITHNTIRDTRPDEKSHGIGIGDATDGAVTISYNTLTNVEGDAIRIATGANGVVVTGNDVIRGTARRSTGQALRFDIKSAVLEDENRVPLTDLRVSGNCFLNYDGSPRNNHGAIWINNLNGGTVAVPKGVGVQITDNVVQSSPGHRSIHVGPSGQYEVKGAIAANQFLGTAPESDAPGMAVLSSNLPITVPATTCR
jgi:hypothetical protein